MKVPFVFWRDDRAGRRCTTGNRVYSQKVYRGFESLSLRHVCDSRVLRNEILRTPSDPEGSSGSKSFRVPQGNLAIVKKIGDRIQESVVRRENTVNPFLNEIILTSEFCLLTPDH